MYALYESLFRTAVVLQHFAAGEPCTLRGGSGGISTFILPPWYKYLEGQTDSTGRCSVAIGNTETDLGSTIGLILLAVFEIALRIGALAAVGFIIYGGIKFILSQGDPENAKTARTIILNSIIGLVIAIIASALVTFLAESVT